MSTDGGLQWYWVLGIVFAVLAISSCLCILWCCYRPKPPKPVPTSSPPRSPRLHFPPLPGAPRLYRPSYSTQWSRYSTTSQKSFSSDHNVHVPFIAVGH